jgi:tetratricopeptide (TPR) repeat protein
MAEDKGKGDKTKTAKPAAAPKASAKAASDADAKLPKNFKAPKIEGNVGHGYEPRSHLLPIGKQTGTPGRILTHETIEYLKNKKEPFEARPGQPTLEDTFTAENVEKFILGDITWGQLHAITQEDAYTFAKYAYAQYEAGRFFDAKKIFQALVIINPYDAYYHMMHGACLQMLDENEAALDEYTAAIQLDNTNIQALVNRAELNLQSARFEEAARDLKRVSDLDPKGTGPATQRARALAYATAQAILTFQGVLNKEQK